LIGRRGGGAESPAARLAVEGSPEFTVFSVPGLNSARVLIGEQELDTANASRVSGKWDRGRVGARGGEKQSGGDGEQSRSKQRARERGKRPAAMLTTTRSYNGGRRRRRSGGTAVRCAAARA